MQLIIKVIELQLLGQLGTKLQFASPQIDYRREAVRIVICLCNSLVNIVCFRCKTTLRRSAAAIFHQPCVNFYMVDEKSALFVAVPLLFK